MCLRAWRGARAPLQKGVAFGLSSTRGDNHRAWGCRKDKGDSLLLSATRAPMLYRAGVWRSRAGWACCIKTSLRMPSPPIRAAGHRIRGEMIAGAAACEERGVACAHSETRTKMCTGRQRPRARPCPIYGMPGHRPSTEPAICCKQSHAPDPIRSYSLRPQAPGKQPTPGSGPNCGCFDSLLVRRPSLLSDPSALRPPYTSPLLFVLSLHIPGPSAPQPSPFLNH